MCGDPEKIANIYMCRDSPSKSKTPPARLNPNHDIHEAHQQDEIDIYSSFYLVINFSVFFLVVYALLIYEN